MTPQRSITSEEEELLNGHTDDIYQKLEEVDPVMARKWHPKDRRRVQRSLEIWFKSGRKASDIYAEQAKARELDELLDKNSIARYRLLMFWTHMDQQLLRERLHARVDDMLEKGLLAEAKNLYKFAEEKESTGLHINRTRGIWASIGLKEFQNFAQLHSTDENSTTLTEVKAEAITRVKLSTYQYAKSQLRWIRTRFADVLRASGYLDRLFLVDWTAQGSDERSVLNESLSIITKFLNGENLPDPSSLSPTAKSMLGKLSDVDSISRRARSRRVCALCDKTFLTEEEWDKHVKGRAHRRAIKFQFMEK